jgi:hypothetical protein
MKSIYVKFYFTFVFFGKKKRDIVDKKRKNSCNEGSYENISSILLLNKMPGDKNKH